MTGGEAILPAASSAGGTASGRLSTQTWPCLSTATESAPPNTQLLGRAFGHDGSSVNAGTGWVLAFGGDLVACAWP